MSQRGSKYIFNPAKINRISEDFFALLLLNQYSNVFNKLNLVCFDFNGNFNDFPFNKIYLTQEITDDSINSLKNEAVVSQDLLHIVSYILHGLKKNQKLIKLINENVTEKYTTERIRQLELIKKELLSTFKEEVFKLFNEIDFDSEENLEELVKKVINNDTRGELTSNMDITAGYAVHNRAELSPPRAGLNTQRAGLNIPTIRLNTPSARLNPPSAGLNTQRTRLNQSSAGLNPRRTRFNPRRARLNPPTTILNPHSPELIPLMTEYIPSTAGLNPPLDYYDQFILYDRPITTRYKPDIKVYSIQPNEYDIAQDNPIITQDNPKTIIYHIITDIIILLIILTVIYYCNYKYNVYWA
ncbi:hypothetical protein NEAUS04_2570 [Nematocida ausubeli]|uniref:Uncharacterized protein n=1 Tax=Nematocida ausubeli (strain ATCC PRA-371 / ERTm2) TaxID=1913371 RepID=A0A086J1W5_NEMA1|nr:uncharacterized protein NESG_01248 [Nematocida ausubeli]KAI5166418.1 hypothetical protein NEAUS04_2570 [Nematocida ausubeli]KFG26133.1 hypothetical protein NESG_01248 [Nematocida ausubeli]